MNTPHGIIPHGIFDIVLGEAMIAVCLLTIILSVLYWSWLKKKDNPISIITMNGALLYAAYVVFRDLYEDYGWSWIQRGQWVGILAGLLFFIGLIAVMKWKERKN